MMRKLLSATVLLGLSFELAAAAEIEIVNSSTKAIHQLQLARKGQRKWGPDRLEGVLAPGMSRVVAGITPDAYDLRLADEEDRDCEIYAVVIQTARRLELTDAKLEECTRESH